MLLTIIIIVLIVLVFSNSNKNKKSQRALNTPPPPPPPPVELSQTDIPSVDIDDIITYKEENGVINAYYNQRALDIYIYNRARTRTDNFTSKNQWKDEINKRPVFLEDLHNVKHIIYNYCLNSGDYISSESIILDLGLESLDLGSYCRSNKISQYETWLYCSVRIFSKYNGYITNHIKPNFLNQYIINDGDLIFSIKLASSTPQMPKEVGIVSFSYDLLPKDFLVNVPYVDEILIKRCLKDNYTKVKEGEEILEVTECSTFAPECRAIIKSPYSGLLVFDESIDKKVSFEDKLERGEILFCVYLNEDLLKTKFPNELQVSLDSFTQSVIISGQKCAGNSSGFKLGCICINFENNGGKNNLILEFDRKVLLLNKLCSLHLLLADNSVITLSPLTNPVKFYGSYYKARFLVSKEDMVKLEKNDFIKWRITNEEGVIIANGKNVCCSDINNESEKTENLSHQVFQDFIIKFNQAVKEHISEEELIDSDSATENLNSTCCVYLMIDTTNNFHKIGISNNPRYREHTLQSDKPTIELLCAKEYPSRAIAEAIESALHKTYASKRIRGEWFNLEPSDIIEVKETLK